MSPLPTRAVLTSLGLILALGGCASPGPDRAPAPLLEAQAAGLTAAATAQPSARWWFELGDAQLTALVERALAGHPSLAIAKARFEQAMAGVAVQSASSSVQVGLGVDVSRQRYTAHGMIPAPIAGHVYDSGNIQLGLNWSPDWWGQHAAEDAAALDQAKAVEADGAMAATQLATQVVRVYVALARLGEHQDLLRQITAERQQALALVARRVQAGLDTQSELNQAQSSLPELAQQQAALDEQMTVLRHQLAALTAQPVDALQALSPRLQSLQPQPLSSDLGADLLGRRPDVVAARWRVEAALQDVKVARTQFYPDVKLSAFVGLNALGLGNVFKAGSEQIGVAPALRLPLFDAGLLRARLTARQAGADAAVAQYNATVLEAVRDAADALSTLQSLEAQRTQQTLQVQHNERTLALAEQRQRQGLTGLTPVLNARVQLLQQRRNAVDLQARDIDSRVLLFKALGGGWNQTPASAATPAAHTPA